MCHYIPGTGYPTVYLVAVYARCTSPIIAQSSTGHSMLIRGSLPSVTKIRNVSIQMSIQPPLLIDCRSNLSSSKSYSCQMNAVWSERDIQLVPSSTLVLIAEPAFRVSTSPEISRRPESEDENGKI